MIKLIVEKLVLYLKKSKQNAKKIGIKKRFVYYVTFLIILIVAIIFIGDSYAIQIARTNASDSYKSTVQLYSNRIDMILGEIDFGMLNLVSKDDHFTSFDSDADELQMTLQQIGLSSTLSEVIDYYPSAGLMFFYDPASDTFVSSSKSIRLFNSESGVRDYARSSLTDEYSYFPSKGSSMQIGSDFFLFRIFKIDRKYIGAFVNTDSFIEDLTSNENPAFAALLFRSSDGNPLTASAEFQSISLKGNIDSYFLTGGNDQYLAVGNRCEAGDFDLFSRVNDSDVVAGQNFLYYVILFCAIVACLFTFVFISLIQKSMINPLLRLHSAIKRLSGGEQDIYIEPSNDTVEFNTVYEAFNEMVREIRRLKIDVYEERISRQKAQLDFYEIQVSPHFFINSINTIYNFAQMNRNDMVMKMSTCITKHFRHTIESGSMTTLGKELEFTRNYLEMQEIRSSYRLTYHMDTDIPPRMLEENVPTLVIQTFVENSVKHTSTKNGYVSVTVKSEPVYMHDANYVKITISDTGDGFSPEILEKLRKGERIADSRGIHIGIYNVTQRLKLIYGDDATILFGNNEDSGAHIEILFPMSFRALPDSNDSYD